MRLSSHNPSRIHARESLNMLHHSYEPMVASTLNQSYNPSISRQVDNFDGESSKNLASTLMPAIEPKNITYICHQIQQNLAQKQELMSQKDKVRNMTHKFMQDKKMFHKRDYHQ